MYQEVIDKLTIFLDSDMKSISLPYMIPISEFEKILLSFGFDKLELSGDETNGWQIDFWYIFKHPNLGTYILTGSLFYGDYCFAKKSKNDK
jgi:hypothetical protein